MRKCNCLLACSFLTLWVGASHAQDLAPNCLDFNSPIAFDYVSEPLWLNRRVSSDESNYDLSDEGKFLLSGFADWLDQQGIKIHFLALPEASLFRPQSARQDDPLYERFIDLYQTYNLDFEELGLNTIDASWMVLQPSLDGVVHRNLDHHLTSRGRYYLAAYIAEQISETANRMNLVALGRDFDDLPKASFPVFEPSGRSYVIGECIQQVDKLAFDEVVTLPFKENASASDLFGSSESQSPAIVIVGTSQSLSAQGNFADFITYFTDMSVENLSEAGGGNSTALQYAGRDGWLTNGTTKHLIWEVSREREESALLGAALSARGMSTTRCSSPDAFTLASDANVTEWIELDLETYPSGQVLNLSAPDHTRGRVHVRFNFEGQNSIETEIWRWSQTQNTSNLGPWALYLPNFEDLDMPSPTSIDVKFEGLYEYLPLTNQRVEVDVCYEEVL